MDRSGIQAAVSGLDAEGLCRRRPVGEGGGQRAASELVVIHNLGTGGEAEFSFCRKGVCGSRMHL